MTFLVDTSVWSLLLRRDADDGSPYVAVLRDALQTERVATTGLILQELLQGAVRQRTRRAIEERFRALLYLDATRGDHVAAADLGNTLRSAGVQVATVDALIAQLAITHDLNLLTTDRDFEHAARHVPLRVWAPQA